MFARLLVIPFHASVIVEMMPFLIVVSGGPITDQMALNVVTMFW